MENIHLGLLLWLAKWAEGSACSCSKGLLSLAVNTTSTSQYGFQGSYDPSPSVCCDRQPTPTAACTCAPSPHLSIDSRPRGASSHACGSEGLAAACRSS